MDTNFKIGDRVNINHYSHIAKGTIREIKNKRIGVLKDSTTTGNITYFSLRNNGNFIAVGYTQDESFAGGYFHNK